jgi:D-psicose/D-tagatose/L-ribulose 3-epimerase
MKIGVDLMLWTGCYDRKCLPLIDKVGKMGFDGVEFPVFAPDAVDVRATRRALADNGLGSTVCTVIVAGSLISPSASDRRKALDHLRRVLDVSKAFGADCVAGPLYSPVGHLIGRGPNAQEWKYAVEGLRKLADTAEQLDIRVGIEPLNRFETYFLNTAGDATRLCREIDSPNVGVHYDTFHANIEEADPVGALRSIGRKRLFHVHTCENDRGIPGTGHVPWDATMKALADMGYKGWITIESFVPAIKELARAASIWRPLAKSGDELASRGLKFLRKYLAPSRLQKRARGQSSGNGRRVAVR